MLLHGFPEAAFVWDEVMAVNVTANYRLIRSMDPLLRQSDAGRAVFVTSGLAHRCWAYWGPYSISKAALEAMVKTYAAENATTAVRANCFSPGATRTDMRARAMPGEDPLGRGVDDQEEPHRLVDFDRLPGEPGAEVAGMTIHDADEAGDGSNDSEIETSTVHLGFRGAARWKGNRGPASAGGGAGCDGVTA